MIPSTFFFCAAATYIRSDLHTYLHPPSQSFFLALRRCAWPVPHLPVRGHHIQLCSCGGYKNLWQRTLFQPGENGEMIPLLILLQGKQKHRVSQVPTGQVDSKSVASPSPGERSASGPLHHAQCQGQTRQGWERSNPTPSGGQQSTLQPFNPSLFTEVTSSCLHLLNISCSIPNGHMFHANPPSPSCFYCWLRRQWHGFPVPRAQKAPKGLTPQRPPFCGPAWDAPKGRREKWASSFGSWSQVVRIKTSENQKVNHLDL